MAAHGAPSPARLREALLRLSDNVRRSARSEPRDRERGASEAHAEPRDSRGDHARHEQPEEHRQDRAEDHRDHGDGEKPQHTPGMSARRPRCCADAARGDHRARERDAQGDERWRGDRESDDEHGACTHEGAAPPRVGAGEDRPQSRRRCGQRDAGERRERDRAGIQRIPRSEGDEERLQRGVGHDDDECDGERGARAVARPAHPRAASSSRSRRAPS